MDIGQIVQEALVSGSAAAVRSQTSNLVGSALRALQSALVKVFASDERGSAVIRGLQESPPEQIPLWSERLRFELMRVPAPMLRELVLQAQVVLASTDPTGTAAGRYAVLDGTNVAGDVHIEASHGVAGWSIGDVTLNNGAPAGPSVPGR